MACLKLVGAGYTVVDRNWRCLGGEIDIVATLGDTWVFVEVKARHGHNSGRPEEAVTPAKLVRIEQAAQCYLADCEITDASWRVDVVAIELDRRDNITSVRILQGLATDAS